MTEASRGLSGPMQNLCPLPSIKIIIFIILSCLARTGGPKCFCILPLVKKAHAHVSINIRCLDMTGAPYMISVHNPKLK